MKIAHITTLQSAILILESRTFYAPKLEFDYGISGIPMGDKYNSDLDYYVANLNSHQYLAQEREVMLIFKWHGNVVDYESASPDIKNPVFNVVSVYPFWKAFLPVGFDKNKLEILSIEPIKNLHNQITNIKDERYFKDLASQLYSGLMHVFTSQHQKERKLIEHIEQLIASKPMITVSTH